MHRVFRAKYFGWFLIDHYVQNLWFFPKFGSLLGEPFYDAPQPPDILMCQSPQFSAQKLYYGDLSQPRPKKQNFNAC
jgi:hypothetical protein